jgi:uncharacterized protein
MHLTGPGLRLRIYIGETDHWHGRPLYDALVIRAREMGMAGATVLRGVEGFGAKSRLHTAKVLRLSENLPMVVEIVDREERVREFLAVCDEMIREGLVTTDPVEIVKYTATLEKPRD